MGGRGSGRHFHWGQKTLTTDLRSLDIRRLIRDGLLTEWRSFNWVWSIDGQETGRIKIAIKSGGVQLDYKVRDYGDEWEPMRYTVPVFSQQMPNGGHRKWFACPARGCGRRVAILYGGKVFACRQCHHLAYPSQRENSFQRLLSKKEKIEKRLGWGDEDGTTYGQRPKGMHQRTFDRLMAEYDRIDGRASMALAGYIEWLGTDRLRNKLDGC